MDDITKLAYSKAQARARRLGGADRVTFIGERWYEVRSSRGDRTYTVEVIERPAQHHYLCDCEAGKHGLCCWHKAAVLLYRVREAVKAASKPTVSVAAREAIWGKGSAS